MSSRFVATSVPLLALALCSACDTGSSSTATTAPPTTTVCKGTLGDRVWKDSNGNGLQDQGEPGIAGIEFRLTDTEGVVKSATTGATGDYLFTGLCGGDYTLEVQAHFDLVPAPANVGPDDSIDSESSPITVTLADDVTTDSTIDFGYTGTGSIGDLVWADENCNGLQDEGELGLRDVRVTLADELGATRETLTVEGFYEFNGLSAGQYTITVDDTTLGPGLHPTLCGVGPDPALDSECSPAAVTLIDDKHPTASIDFGYCPPLPSGSIGDFIWHDLDGDGLQGAEEPGIEGIPIFLGDRAGNTLASTLTDADGQYLFELLPAGQYVLEVVAPGCFTPAPCNVGNDDSIDNDCSPAFVTLVRGQRERSIDFGYSAVGSGQIGVRIWDDRDGDGLREIGEAGIDRARVTLFDEWGSALETRWTGPDGDSRFDGLCSGRYEVGVDLSASSHPRLHAPGVSAQDGQGPTAWVTLPFDDTLELGIGLPCTTLLRRD